MIPFDEVLELHVALAPPAVSMASCKQKREASSGENTSDFVHKRDKPARPIDDTDPYGP
jgi:hypothetical protein